MAVTRGQQLNTTLFGQVDPRVVPYQLPAPPTFCMVTAVEMRVPGYALPD